MSETKLITQIREDGIYVRFPPFQPSFNKYTWNTVKDLYVRKYDAIGEFYGWGIRIGNGKKGYIVSGDIGIQIEFYDNTVILITTQQPEEIEDVLRNLKK